MDRRNLSGSLGTRVAPWAALTLGLVATAALWTLVHVAWSSRREQDFATARNDVVSEMNAIVERQVSMLHATAGLVESNPSLSQRRFTRFYKRLHFSRESPEPEAIGLSLGRPWARREELAHEAALRGVAGYRFRPEGPRKEAYAVMLIEPLDKANAAAPGFDMHAERLRAEAMDYATAHDAPAMTGRVSLAKDAGVDHPSVLVYLPVHDGEGRAVGDCVYCGLHTEELFNSLFAGGRTDAGNDPLRRGIGLRVWSGDPKDGDLLFHHDLSGDAFSTVDRKIDLDAVHATLFARFVATEEFGKPSVILPFVAPAGVSISLMLFALALTLRNANAAAERRAAEQSLLAASGRLAFDDANDDALAAFALKTAHVLGAICRVDLLESGGALHTVNTREGQDEALAELERAFPRLENDELLKRALETRKTQRASAPTTGSEAHRVLVERLNIGPVVVVPMLSRDRAIGALTLSRPQGRPPLARDAVALAEAVADRVALAVDNARLYRASQQELEERRLAEAEVRRLNDGLEEIVAERTRDLEASNHELESFCYSVSHDLRTPLRSLDGFGRALKEDYGDALDDQAHDYIDRIRAATKRMDELITALLTLSRLTRREIVPTEIDVSIAVRDAMADLDPEGRAELVVAPDLRVQADPRMFAVALENLLSNALKFTGRVDSPRIEVGRADDGAIFVRDNGAGFDPAYSTKLFLPFERLHSVREFPGHGIGLATVERILRRHGGSVHADGKPGDGATFRMKFPG